MTHISKSRGKGKCWNCGNNFEKGDPVLVVDGHSWVKARYCHYCVNKFEQEMYIMKEEENGLQ